MKMEPYCSMYAYLVPLLSLMEICANTPRKDLPRNNLGRMSFSLLYVDIQRIHHETKDSPNWFWLSVKRQSTECIWILSVLFHTSPNYLISMVMEHGLPAITKSPSMGEMWTPSIVFGSPSLHSKIHFLLHPSRVEWAGCWLKGYHPVHALEEVSIRLEAGPDYSIKNNK